MKKSIKVDPIKCVACKLCELACVFGREKVYNPKKSRIRIHLVGIPELPSPVITRLCDQCGGKPRCVEICPVGAVTYEEDNPRPDVKTISDPKEVVYKWLDGVMPKDEEPPKEQPQDS